MKSIFEVLKPRLVEVRQPVRVVLLLSGGELPCDVARRAASRRAVNSRYYDRVRKRGVA